MPAPGGPTAALGRTSGSTWTYTKTCGRQQLVDLDALALRAADGDKDALDELLAEIQPRVRRICGRMLLYPQDAEEACQDALMLVATRIDTFAGRAKFTTWLHAVAVQQRPLDLPLAQAPLRRAAQRRPAARTPTRAPPA